MSPTKNIGVILGRLQPFHAGHVILIDHACEENDEIVIAIGSPQNGHVISLDTDPLDFEERAHRVALYMHEYHPTYTRYRIVSVPDINDMRYWPSHLKRMCLIGRTQKAHFYTGEKLPETYAKGMRDGGYIIRHIPRGSFEHTTPDGVTHMIACATDIRALHRDRGFPI